MAWPFAFFTFIALLLFKLGHMPAAALATATAIISFTIALRRYGQKFLPVLLAGFLLGGCLFFARARFFATQTLVTEGVASVSVVSRRSVILTLENQTRLRLIGFRNEKLPLRGAVVEFSCRATAIPEGKFAVFERLAGIRTWCEKNSLQTLAPPRLAPLRAEILNFLHQRFAALGERSLIAAFLLGETETMPEETLAAFRDMGLMHLFAVSGLNVALLFALLYIPFRLAGIPGFGAALGFLVATAFLLLLDFPIPLFRAWLFLAIGAMAKLLDRRLDPWTLLFLTALIVEIIFPLSTFSISFILSFGITAAILLFYQPLFFCFSGDHRVRQLLASHVALTLAAGLPAFILSYVLFGSAQVLALLYNLLLVPFSGIYLFFALLYIPLDSAGFLIRNLDSLYFWFAEKHSAIAMRQLPVVDEHFMLLPLTTIAFTLLALLYLQWRNRLWSAKRNLRLIIPCVLVALVLPWFIAPRVNNAFYAVPNQVWNFESGKLTSAGRPLHNALTPNLCLPVASENLATERAGLVKLRTACFGFAAALKPEEWQSDELKTCDSLNLFQAKTRTTTTADWQKLFSLFGLRGKLYLRHYFVWYSDAPLSCAKSQRI